jgi:hypothetical protein
MTSSLDERVAELMDLIPVKHPAIIRDAIRAALVAAEDAALERSKAHYALDAEIAHQVRLLYQVTSSATAAQILDAADRALKGEPR